jgi:hypothetical protein
MLQFITQYLCSFVMHAACAVCPFIRCCDDSWAGMVVEQWLSQQGDDKAEAIFCQFSLVTRFLHITYPDLHTRTLQSSAGDPYTPSV